MNEIWVEIRPGLEVSNLGRVRKYLDGHFNGEGYLCVSNGKRGAGRTPIHTLVAEAFYGPRPNGAVVRHLNDNKVDNRADNLAYGTRSENALDAIRNGKVDYSNGERKDHLARIAVLGGQWWKGKKRAGQRGAVVKDAA